MAKKDVDKYYEMITEQYHEMLQDIKDFEKEVEEGVVEPERVERLREQIAPIKDNWQRWTYMMYLLNKPQRKSKYRGYEQRNKKLLEHLSKENSVEATIAENENARKKIGT